jgi:hypothetical protein
MKANYSIQINLQIYKIKIKLISNRQSMSVKPTSIIHNNQIYNPFILWEKKNSA